MIFHLITVSTIIEKKNEVYILINTRYFTYKAISSRFVKKTGLKCIDISIRKLIGIKEKKNHINKIIKINIDIDRYQQDIFFYIIRDYLGYNLIFKKP